jgi:TctA family transporter
VEIFHDLIHGFSIALSIQNSLYCFVGCLVGTLMGFARDWAPGDDSDAAAVHLHAPAHIGADYAVRYLLRSSVWRFQPLRFWVNLPGETASVITCIDGYQMARHGRAGPALAISAIGSFFAGTVCTLIIAMFGPPLAEMALKFGSPEYFSLMLMALVTAAVMAHGDMLKSLAMVVIGLLLGIVGADIFSSVDRFTFGKDELIDGIDFVTIAIGLFAVGEIISNLSATPR